MVARPPGVAGDEDRAVMFVHAHPDDESIETGATIARYTAEGAHVTLVTCTLGELGEIIPPRLAHLAADLEDRLGEHRIGEHRIGELAAACEALGVSDQRFLGGLGRWRDSGMMGLPSNNDPGCFWQADVDEAAAELARIIREVRPQVVVSYDANGFYGHPDHIQAHRVTLRAVALAARAAGAAGEVAEGAGEVAKGGGGPADGHPPWRVAKVYAIAMPRSVLAGAIKLGCAGTAGSRFTEAASVADLPFGMADDEVTTVIDGRAHLPAKVAALRAHATQIAVEGEFFALSDMVGRRILGREHYTLLSGPRGAGTGPRGLEHDLFAGL